MYVFDVKVYFFVVCEMIVLFFCFFSIVVVGIGVVIVVDSKVYEGVGVVEVFVLDGVVGEVVGWC